MTSVSSAGEGPAASSASAVSRSIVQIYGQRNSRLAFELRDYLTRSVVDFGWTTLDNDLECRVITGMTLEDAVLPVVDMPDGTRLVAPTISEIASRLGWVKGPRLREYDLSIYGAGPAGLSAAVYAASEGLNVVLLEREVVGGQAGYSSLIENYLGFPRGIAGADLAERAREQAVGFGAELLLLRGGIRGEFRNDRMLAHLTDGTIMTARANICATGVEWRRLGVDGEDTFLGLGLYYGAGTSEASNATGQDVFVIGGGNSAGQAVLNLAAHARTVTMLVRGPDLAETLSTYLLDRLRRTPNVRFLMNTHVTRLEGGKTLEAIEIKNLRTGARATAVTAMVFVCIGGSPDTGWADRTPIERDSLGYLVTGPDISPHKIATEWPLSRAPFYLETSVPGSFAAGDVRRNSVKRVAAAVGEGAMAVTFAHRFLGTVQ